MTQNSEKKETRSGQQNNAIHLWYAQKTEQCREHGITLQMVFEKTIDLEMTPQIMKEIWRRVQKAMYKKDSTTQLDKSNGEIEDIAEHLNRFFAEH